MFVDTPLSPGEGEPCMERPWTLQGPKASLGGPWAWPMERERMAVGLFRGPQIHQALLLGYL